MSSLLEFLADVLASGYGPRKDNPVIRFFVVLTMGIAGVCFLVFAGIVAARVDIVGVIGALIFVALSGLCFWLVWRGRRH